MIGAHRRRMEKLDREAVFIVENDADLKNLFDALNGDINAKRDDILALDAQLTVTFDDKYQQVEIKGDRRDDCLDQCRRMILGSQAIGNAAVPGITTLFQMPEPRTDQNIIAKLTAMHEQSEPFEAQFVAAGLPAGFRGELLTTRDAFQSSRDEVDAAVVGHSEAVGSIAAAFREVMAMSRQRSALIRLKYAGNAGKLAAWAVASHLEKAPSRPNPPIPPPTT